MPLAFFLLANKHRTSYDDILRHTESEAAKLGVNIIPPIVYAYFKTAIYNAKWPDCEVNPLAPEFSLKF